MEIFGFIVAVMFLVLATCAWMFMLIMDGAWGGKRDIPVYVMVIILCLIIWGFISVTGYSPFEITVK